MIVIFVQIMKYYLILQQIKMDISNINQILINVQFVNLGIIALKAKIIKKSSQLALFCRKKVT